jgi:HEAT repeat protein
MPMNQILQWLTEGDRRGDGLSDQAAEFVLKNQGVLGDLIEGLNESDDVVRGRTADALEKIARLKPEWVRDQIPKLIEMAEVDSVVNVGMHIAMIFGHLANYEEDSEGMIAALLGMLREKKVFVRSWVISSLCIFARLYPHKREGIIERIAPLNSDPSIAIRTRVRYAMEILTNENVPFPKGWVKAEGLKYLEKG